MFDALVRWWNKPADDVSQALDEAFKSGRRIGIEESAQLCEAKAYKFVEEEMRTIGDDEWPDDFNEDDEFNPRTAAENGAKATGWMMLQCAADIRKIISNAELRGRPLADGPA